MAQGRKKGFTQSEETRRKISDKLKLTKAHDGVSMETRIKIRDSKLGTKKTDAQRKNQSDKMKAYHARVKAAKTNIEPIIDIIKNIQQ